MEEQTKEVIGSSKSPNTGGNSSPTVPGTGNTILAWMDDPMSDVNPVQAPVPNLNKPPLALQIEQNAPAPMQYQKNTKEFRYWVAAEALRRGADFWAQFFPTGKSWEPGSPLQVLLDEGEDFNAYYDRNALNFFHGAVGIQTIYSGESPDVLCHELGHAILDALRPQFWNIASIEVPAFHESFGDISAILSQLQIQAFRQLVLTETGGKLYRSSRLSRLAEQLGWAIRQTSPQAVDSDCLRNAVNNFFYHDPKTLPPSSPASSLCREPHSFSRVFTSAFFEAMSNMLDVEASPATEQALLKISHAVGQLLIDAVQVAPIASNFYSQVAAHLIEADHTRFSGKYSTAIKNAFVRHGILSLHSAAALPQLHAALPAMRYSVVGSVIPETSSGLPTLALSVSEYGLGDLPLLVEPPSEPKRFQVSSAALDLSPISPPSQEVAARIFVEDLLQRDRIDLGTTPSVSFASTSRVRKTHKIIREQGSLRLVRNYFDCRFD